MRPSVMLVSAIEVAAGFWSGGKGVVHRAANVRRGQTSQNCFTSTTGDKLVSKVSADKIADYMGATNKFTDFICEHRPAPPRVRPSKGAQVSWELNAMRRHLKKRFIIIGRWHSMLARRFRCR